MRKELILIPLVAAVGILIFPFVAYYGNDIMVISSDSMLPVLKPHDLIIVQRISIEDVEVGDIITYDSHIPGIGIVAHRAIEITNADGDIRIDTQGDNTGKSDPWTVHKEDLIGKVVNVIPKMGILLIDPVRYSLVAVIIITAVSLLKDSISETKKTTKSEN